MYLVADRILRKRPHAPRKFKLRHYQPSRAMTTASFERIRYCQHDGDVFLYAFDLIELSGDDLRRGELMEVATWAIPDRILFSRFSAGRTNTSTTCSLRLVPVLDLRLIRLTRQLP